MSSNPYDAAKDDPDSLEDALLGKWNYNYFEQIKGPGDLGVGSDGSLSQMGTDWDAMKAYGELLSTGGGNASKIGRPLGNKFFLRTGASCKKPDGTIVPRYSYFDFVPSGYLDVSMESDGTGQLNLGQSFRGLLPGALEDMTKLNPLRLFQAFTMGSEPPCHEVTLPVGNAGEPGVDPPSCSVPGSVCETHALLDSDIRALPPSTFPADHPNPIEGFIGSRRAPKRMDFPERIFIAFSGFACLYVLGKLLLKDK